MNMLMLNDVYFPRVNGVSTSIRSHLRELAARGHAVTLVAPAYPDAAMQSEPVGEVLRLPARALWFDPEDRLMHGGPLRAALRQLATTAHVAGRCRRPARPTRRAGARRHWCSVPRTCTRRWRTRAREGAPPPPA